jgi:hypothetical protein
MNDIDELNPAIDPEALRVNEFDVRNVAFVIPLDCPVPSELSDVPVPTGSLYDRLAALNQEVVEEFAFVPLSGSELLALERAWRSLQLARRVFVLADLPGARYDVLFTQAARQIGLPTVEWPAVAEAMASRVRIVQRTNDATPWQMPKKRTQLPVSSTESEVSSALPIPAESDED